ncbi:hypothetical protein B0H13DRAFT_685677 [Mycena leptocephala]|nr:hypothetical protein B0H13DRAFT_685677 [Mycena leptocephala]
MLPNSESWDVCTFKTVDLEDLPAQAIASLEHVKSDGVRIYEVRQEEEKSQRSALRKSALREKRNQVLQASADATSAKAAADRAEKAVAEAQASAKAASADATSAKAAVDRVEKAVAKIQADNNIFKRVLILSLNARIVEMKQSLTHLSVVLLWEVVDRLMKGIDRNAKAALSSTDVLRLKAAHVNWVGTLIELDAGNPQDFPAQTLSIAKKAVAALSRAEVALFKCCREASNYYGTEQRRRQHPIVTTAYAEKALAKIAQDVRERGDSRLDVELAKVVIATHSSATRSKAALFADGDSDPREAIEDSIADLEAQLALLDTVGLVAVSSY